MSTVHYVPECIFALLTIEFPFCKLLYIFHRGSQTLHLSNQRGHGFAGSGDKGGVGFCFVLVAVIL